MLGLLLLNVAISGNAFTVADLQSRRSVLVDQQQALEQQLLVQGSPVGAGRPGPRARHGARPPGASSWPPTAPARLPPAPAP